MKMTRRTRRSNWGTLGGLSLAQRPGNGDSDGGTAHGLTAAGQGKPARGAKTEEITKELHWPISSITVPTAPLGAGRTSLVEESAGQPLAVAANDQLVMQCRHPMLADVDVATRVNVHMPWLVRTEARPAKTAPVGAGIVLLRCESVKPWPYFFFDSIFSPGPATAELNDGDEQRFALSRGRNTWPLPHESFVGAQMASIVCVKAGTSTRLP